ncbi:MAG TPA: anti-sigma factor antagonist [Bryobacterales bacterium]|nr:anti-sigma factor antagonist [Bryobacterales bacterium]
MSLEITRREKEGVRILALKGRLTAGEEVEGLRRAIREEIEAGNTKLILDLAGVDYIDSTGLGTLVVCYTRVKRAGGALKLLNLNRREIQLLVLTKLTTVFELFDDEQDAVNSFFPGRKIKRFDILSFVKKHSRE